MMSRRAAAHALLKGARVRVEQLIDDAPRAVVQRVALRVAVAELTEASGMEERDGHLEALTGAMQAMAIWHLRKRDPQEAMIEDMMNCFNRAMDNVVTMQALLTSANTPKLDGHISLDDAFKLAGVSPEWLDREKKGIT